jgi:CRISPR-associated protein Csn2
MGEIENQVSLWAFDFPCDIVTTKVSPSSILKSVGIEIRDSYDGQIGEAEKILDYMELVREFDREKLFITLNMRSFFEDNVMESFLQTVVSHEFKVLMIENKAYERLSFEKRLTVDEDLCEF